MPQNFNEVLALISKQIHRGVQTNLFLPTEALRFAYENGLLGVHQIENGLILLLQRPGHQRLYYYLQETAVLPTFCPQMPMVVEIPYRKMDSTTEKTISQWKCAGFTQAVERLRMRREAENRGNMANNVRIASEPERASIAEIFKQSFHPYIGCLPTKPELILALNTGQILCAYKEDKPIGLLHCADRKKGTEIAHLAVVSSEQHQGVGQKLLCSYFAVFPGKSVVWVQTHNKAARSLYEKNGYVPDGMNSVVLICEKKPQRAMPVQSVFGLDI